jgi:hypothetical protein
VVARSTTATDKQQNPQISETDTPLGNWNRLICRMKSLLKWVRKGNVRI